MIAYVSRLVATVILLALIAGNSPALASGSPWGASYFPNVELTTQDGEKVRFFDDLIKDKIVAINFIYTSCPDTCPLETAQLVKVQQLLGDRMGDDVHFYSISIDPAADTPEVLSEYRDRFRARWTFLTGNEADIIQLRRKLGLYVEEIQDGSNNHNVNMIIGNQKTGRWMKRSPFENPYVLADQIGNWLDGWKLPQQGESYANAPQLRDVSLGEQLFRTRCATCHGITGTEQQDALGPDLFGVVERRDMTWLLNWLRAPDQMLEKKDPIAMAMLAQYDNLAMPNMRLNRKEVDDLIDYMQEETLRLDGEIQKLSSRPVATSVAGPGSDVVAVMNAWVRESDPAAKALAGYMTLVNVGNEDVRLVEVFSKAFGTIEVHEMAVVNGMMKMQQLNDLIIPAESQLRFEPGGKHLMLKQPVTSLNAGETVEMTLVFDSGASQIISVLVANR